MEALKGGEIEVGEDVAVHDEEALLEQRFRELDRACRVQRLLLLDVMKARSTWIAVTEDASYLRGEKAARHHDVVDAVRREPVDHVRDERPVRERKHGLRNGR